MGAGSALAESESEVAYLEAVDWSMFQPAHSAEDMARLRKGNVDMVIVGAWHGDNLGRNPHCRNDLALARAEGLRTGLYIVLDSPRGTDGPGAVHQARANCGEEWDHASLIALDVELPGVTVADVRAAAEEVRSLGKTPVIYTAHWFWHDTFGNPRELCDIPLWNAFYDYDNDVSYGSLPYGCWEEEHVVAEQYQSTSLFRDMEMDHNVVRLDFIEAIEAGQAASLVVDCAERNAGGILLAHAALHAEVLFGPEADCAPSDDLNGDGELNALDALAALQRAS